LATRVIELTPNGIVDFQGNYEEYLKSQDIV
jgi:ATPase subunit of ABC transporter with duplicated ATPase domains